MRPPDVPTSRQGAAGPEPVAVAGVTVRPLRQIPDERGRVMHMLRSDDPEFESFGEIYFSMVHPGVVKGWHRHRVMALNYAVVQGTVKLVVADDRPGSPTAGRHAEIYLGEGNYALAHVPPGIWNGFKGVGSVTAIVANCASHAHDPDEIERMDPFTKHLGYDWSLRHG